MIDDSAYTYMEKARTLVRRYISERLDKSDPPVEFTVYLVWFSKTLQNWKALVSSTLPDGMYYEVTYDGEMRQTYIDAYKKVENVRVTDNAFEQLEIDLKTGGDPFKVVRDSLPRVGASGVYEGIKDRIKLDDRTDELKS
jgi:hypothetical protein